VGEAGDKHEKHADAVADRVVQGKSATDLLSSYAPAGGGAGVQRKAVQRDPYIPMPSHTTYVVKPGDTLQTIAASQLGDATRFGDIVTLNGITDPDKIQAGQTLKIPTKAPSATTGVTKSPTATTAPVSPTDPAWKADVTASKFTKFGLQLDIPVWGPISVQIKIDGGYTLSTGTGGTSTKVEASVYGGILIDLFFFKLTAGIQGAVSFTVNGLADPITAIKKGMTEIANWQIAKDFKPTLDKKRADAKAAFDRASSRMMQSTSRLTASIASGKWKEATDGGAWGITQWLCGADEADNMDNVLRDLKGDIGGAFREFNPNVDTSKFINQTLFQQKMKAIHDAKDKTAATAAARAFYTFWSDSLTKSKTDVDSNLAKCSTSYNDPNVDFEASVAFVAGASIQLTGSVGVGLTYQHTWSVGDSRRDGGWDTGVTEADQVTGTVTIGDWTVSASGTWVGDEFDLGIGIEYGSSSFLSGGKYEAQVQTLQDLRKLMTSRKSALMAFVGQKSSNGIKGFADCISNMAKTQEGINKALPKVYQSEGGGLNFTLKFKKGKWQGGTISLFAATKMSAGKVFGGGAGVGISGYVSQGGSVEISYGPP